MTIQWDRGEAKTAIWQVGCITFLVCFQLNCNVCGESGYEAEVVATYGSKLNKFMGHVLCKLISAALKMALILAVLVRKVAPKQKLHRQFYFPEKGWRVV